MPTAPETVAALDHALRLPGASAAYWRDRLIGAGIVQSSRGAVREQLPHEIVSTIIAIAIGYKAAGRPALALEYGSLVATDGSTLSDRLIEALDRPEDLLEFRLMSDEPAAALRVRGADGNVSDIVFIGADIGQLSGLERHAVISGNTWTALVAALRNPPIPQSRSRRRRRRRTQ